MNRIIYFSVLALMLSGCGKAPNDVLSAFFGKKYNVVIITDKVTKLTPKELEFDLKKPAKVVGKDAAVCVVLRGNYPLRHQSEMDSEFNSLMKGVKLFASVYSESGKSLNLVNPMQSWSKYGHVIANDEFSACMRVDCGKNIPVGTQFKKISIFSSAPISVKGIYWESTNEWDDIN